MRRFKLFVGLCVFMALSLFITGIYGYFKMTTSPAVNTLSVKDKTTYTVVHKTMNTDGTTYSDYFTESYEATIGTTVTPATLTPAQLPGFTAPATQTVTLNSFQNTTITYLYTRNQYDLTITNPQYVNTSTSTPAGTYYYGTTIHLEAFADDGNGNNFVKWSNNNTNRIYEFTLEEDTTIGPIYTDKYQVTYVLNNGDPDETRLVNNDEPINYLPNNISYNDCTGSTGDRIADGCTYDYELVGWYTESTFENQVNEQYMPNHDVTLYARWNKVFFYQAAAEQFNGDHLVDSGIPLFNEFNINKDFIVEFTIDSFANNNPDRAVLFADMNEANGDPYPGIQFRWFQGSFNVNANANDKNHKKNTAVSVNVGDKIILKRDHNNFLYSLDNGATFVNFQDYSVFDKFFDIPATFGGQSDKPERNLIGSLSEMRVEFIERPSYTIKFHSNSGNGMMLDQIVEVGTTVNLNDKEYVKEGYAFTGWNTAADGSGTSYTNKQQITDIANDGDVVDLYAQWERIRYYYLHFDANGGNGTMTNQQIIFNEETAIKPVEFTKTGYGFFGWNTESDGSGTWYEDEQSILNIASDEDEIITLYAIFLKTRFERIGNYTFDGTETTFMDTGVNLYSDNTIMNKDFEIRFTVTSVADTVISVYTQATILNCKDESNNKWPGFNVRFESNSRFNMIPQYKWNNAGSSSRLPAISINKVPVEMVFKRRDGIVYFSYTDKDGNGTTTLLYNQTSWILNQYFADNCSFGGIYNSSHQPDRFFTGTISDMRIIVEE